METRLPPKQKIVGSTPTGIVFYVIAFYSLLNLFLFFFFFLFSFFLSTFYFYVMKARVAEWSKAAV